MHLTSLADSQNNLSLNFTTTDVCFHRTAKKTKNKKKPFSLTIMQCSGGASWVTLLSLSNQRMSHGPNSRLPRAMTTGFMSKTFASRLLEKKTTHTHRLTHTNTHINVQYNTLSEAAKQEVVKSQEWEKDSWTPLSLLLAETMLDLIITILLITINVCYNLVVWFARCLFFSSVHAWIKVISNKIIVLSSFFVIFLCNRKNDDLLNRKSIIFSSLISDWKCSLSLKTLFRHEGWALRLPVWRS